MRVLNLYAGLGGNRLHWKNCEVTAVEMDAKIAGFYESQFHDDVTIVGDAHDYLLNNWQDFDFIWSSPPCQSHSRFIKSGRNRKPRYPDMRLYEEILFLNDKSHQVKFIVENVVPWYPPMCNPQKIGRHLFWSNIDLFGIDEVPQPKDFINRQNKESKLMLLDWLGLPADMPNIYYNGNHDPTQVLRNCVHPKVGEAVFLRVKELCNKS